jgi:protein phosphatase PTC6
LLIHLEMPGASALCHGTRDVDLPQGGWAPSKTHGGMSDFSLTSRLDIRSLPHGLGDLKWKSWGVTAEPEVKTMLIESQQSKLILGAMTFNICLIGSQWAFMIFVSDGVSSVVSDQEIVDLARGATSPKHAANRILSFAEEMGSSDNLTAIVLPFAGWGHVSGPDQSKNLRAYRSSQMSQSFIPLRK